MNVNELFNYYQKQVSEIPKLRQLVDYKCEIAVASDPENLNQQKILKSATKVLDFAGA